MAQTPPLRVVADDDYPPYAFRDSAGNLQGIVVDQWREWERVTGTRVELVGLAWDEALLRMKAGEADVIDTMFDTPERHVLYDFCPAYAAIDSSVFFHQTISGLATLADLKGFRIAVKEGDALVDTLKANGVSDFAYYPNYEDIVKAAALGEERIFCIDKPPALYYLNKLGIERYFRSSVSIPGGEFHRAVTKGRSQLLRSVQIGFDAIPRSTYAAINRKWLGTGLLPAADLRVLVVAAFTVMALFLFFLVVASSLRRRIARATEELRLKLKELEASQAKNRAFIAALPDLFFTFDRDGRYLELSVSSEEQLILPPERFLGKLASEVDLGPGLSDRLLECVRTALDEKRLMVMEYEARLESGLRRFEGRFVPLDAERVILVSRDITEARKHEELLEASLAEKEVLLREVHHRVKNNLQVISSLVSLQESSCVDQTGRDMNRDTQARVRSMAHLHELLYGSKDLSSIDPADYIASIVSEISGYYESTSVRVDAESDALSIDQAMPFGLIATELVTNAFKYAYPPGSSGEILVGYRRAGAERLLEVRDEGVGLPIAFDPASTTSLGFTLVRSLAEQIDGRLEIGPARPGDARPGLKVVLAFPA